MTKIPRPKRLAIGSSIVKGPYVACEGDVVLVGVGNDTIQSRDRKTLKVIHDFGRQPGFLWGGVKSGAVVAWESMGPKAGVKDVRNGSVLWVQPSREPLAIGRGKRVVVVDNTSVSVLTDVGQLVYRLDEPAQQLGGRVLSDDLAFITVGDHTIAISSDGLELWRRPLKQEIFQRGDIEEGPAQWFAAEADAGECFAFGTCGTCKISLLDGSILWVSPLRSPVSPVFTHDLVLGTELSRVFAIERVSGRPRFDVRHPELDGAYRDKTGVTYGRRHAFCYESGQLAVVDIDTGALVTFLQWKKPLWRMLELDGRLLVATGDGELLVFDESIWGI